MALVQPVDMESAMQRRANAAAIRGRVALNDNHGAGGHCPACGAWAPIAPVGSGYLGGGLIHHHWQCEPCGHAWVTAVRVLS
jgi:hypothetical protein